mmetsp:Transcript_18338/g.38315  ORF Transcript_18338/g.38315 Transcript_18338/m.38315 type:complete len:253 (-) Transcript_18338:221-979(-)
MPVPAWAGLKRVIIVCGHAIFRGASDVKGCYEDRNWILQSFQRGEPVFYVDHVKKGVELASKDPEALLVFTGGQSRQDDDLSPWTEAQSYVEVARMHGWWGHTANVAWRTTTEEFARDSFENLLFALCRFYEAVGRFPDHLTLVSWNFKDQRFHMHREAILWPSHSYTYVGSCDPVDMEVALKGEQKTLEAYSVDPYCTSPELLTKRHSRNPYSRQHGYFSSCPESVALLLRYTGPELFGEVLPWSNGKCIN